MTHRIIADLFSAAAIGCCTLTIPAGARAEDDQSAFPAGALRDRPLAELIAVTGAGPYDVRPAADYVDNYADDIGDGFFFAPGVAVHAIDLQEPRITMRGFGLLNIQQRSAATMLRDGAPLTDVHGVTNFSELDLLSIGRIDIRRGGASVLAPGATSLGGVVDLVSRRAETEAAGVSARVDAGASLGGWPGGQAHAAIAGGDASSLVDFFASVTGLYELGFRDNNRRDSAQFHGNIGLRPLERLVTRFFVDVADSRTDLAGGLEQALAASDPESATPAISLGPLFPGGPVFDLVTGAGTDDFSRDVREARIANTTQFSLLGHDVELGGHFTRREVASPQIDFVGFIEESGGEWGARAALGRDFRLFGVAGAYRVGGTYATGSQRSDRFENIFGSKGDVLALTDQESKQLTGFAEGVVRPLKRLAVDFGAKFIRVDRTLVDREDDSDERRRYTGVAARLGVLATLTRSLEAFASASRAYEPPAMAALVADDPTSFNDLEEQDSFALEAGLRGHSGQWLAWDVTWFDMDVENEIVNIADPSSFVSGDVLVNAAKTTHKGVEAAVDVSLFPKRFARSGAALTLRNVYAYSNFRFTDAGFAGGVDGARMAGTPAHRYRGELRYDARDDWFFAVNVDLARGAYFADHENTVSVAADPVFGFSAGYQLRTGAELYLSGENVTDRAHVAGVTPVLDFDEPYMRVFSPGARAALFAGLKVRL